VRVAAQTVPMDCAFQIDWALDKIAVMERLKTGAMPSVTNEYRGRAEFFADSTELAEVLPVRNLVSSLVRYELGDRGSPH
jgi:hypothetical protein